MSGSITIDQSSWSFDELQRLSEELGSSSSHWKASVGRFLNSWISDQDHIVVHTSGSTGTRKSIELSKKMMRHSAQITAQYFDLPQGSKTLLCLSPDYIAGMMMIVRSIENGWDLTVVEPNSSPLENSDGDYDFCAMVPLQVENSLDQSLAKLKQIGTLIIGGTAVDSDQVTRLEQAGVTSFATYGMTETATHIAVKKLSPIPSDHFTVLPGYTITVDSRGCLCIEAPHLDNPVQTHDSIEFTSSGFRLLGRIDNVINSGGIKVFPEEVESKLAEILRGISFYISASQDLKLGQKVTLVIEGQEIQDRNILEECSTKVDSFQKPRLLIFEPNFNRTETGKIVRKKFP